jgi:hypothetical protein
MEPIAAHNELGEVIDGGRMESEEKVGKPSSP